MQVEKPAHSNQHTLTDVLRARFKGIIEPVVALIARLGISPSTLTLIGLLGNFIAAIVLSQGEFLIGGLIVLFMGPLDALDGALARQLGEESDLGAFVDSVSDRYSELLIFGGLLMFFLRDADWISAGWVFAAACGSVMVSYVRARAESVGYTAKIGVLTRVERFVVLVPSLVLNYPRIGMAIIAVLGNFTALQRIYHVFKQARIQ
jgi:CDP-diacylglycerol--glycerol-3-phosphate 3-phosphatidyltransferase